MQNFGINHTLSQLRCDRYGQFFVVFLPDGIGQLSNGIVPCLTQR
jgi:hypothetical protein